jgi:hypothetical protein
LPVFFSQEKSEPDICGGGIGLEAWLAQVVEHLLSKCKDPSSKPSTKKKKEKLKLAQETAILREKFNLKNCVHVLYHLDRILLPSRQNM